MSSHEIPTGAVGDMLCQECGRAMLTVTDTTDRKTVSVIPCSWCISAAYHRGVFASAAGKTASSPSCPEGSEGQADICR